jgi:hypothetical protein
MSIGNVCSVIKGYIKIRENFLFNIQYRYGDIIIFVNRNDTGEVSVQRGIVVLATIRVFPPSQTKNHRTTEVKDPFYEDLHYEGYTELCIGVKL